MEIAASDEPRVASRLPGNTSPPTSPTIESAAITHIAAAKPSGTARVTSAVDAIDYVAFLRGINILGRRSVSMADVRKVFESAGLAEVRTLGASGNVMFRSRARDRNKLVRLIRAALKTRLGYDIPVIIRRITDLARMVASDPFRGVPTANAKQLVTLLASAPADRATYRASDGAFRIVRVTDDAVFAIRSLDEKRGSKLLAYIDAAYGKGHVTRTWSVISKLARPAVARARQ